MLTFCITGTLSKPREVVKQAIEARGHKVSSSVTNKTDYLLAGLDAGSKLDKAHSLGVFVMREDMLDHVLDDADETSGRRVKLPRAWAPDRTIYHFYTDDYGEAEGMFDEHFKLLGAWSRNDAHYRSEYMDGFMKALGIQVKPLPANRERAALDAISDHFGWGDDFGD